MPTLDNGGWVPEDHPLWTEQLQKKKAAGSTTVAAPPEYQAQSAGTGAAPPQDVPGGGGDMTPQQAGAAGLGWVPKDHPLYGTPGYVGSTGAGGGGGAGAGGTTYTPPNAAPGTPGATAIDTQNQNAQTYSTTPGAAPSNATTNQGTQDVVRNSYLQTLQKGTAVDTTDPNFRQQADAFGSAQERARRNMIDDAGEAAFAAGARGAGGNLVEQRMINEGAARNVGQFEAELVGRELQSRRDEIKNALGSLGGMIDNDQRNALQRELAALDAAIKRESLAQTGSLGSQDLSLRNKLGTGALNIDLIRTLLQNQQFGTSTGVDMGQFEALLRARYAGV